MHLGRITFFLPELFKHLLIVWFFLNPKVIVTYLMKMRDIRSFLTLDKLILKNFTT